jgi:hypothetical protein
MMLNENLPMSPGDGETKSSVAMPGRSMERDEQHG